MDSQAAFWADCLKVLKHKQDLALLLVVDSRGSSPGKTGAKMLLTGEGTSIGTIGGGLVEYNLSVEVIRLLQQPESCSRLFYQQHNGSGGEQVCGGAQTVLFYRCTPVDLAVL